MCRVRECTAPHYLLLCEARSFKAENASGGKWTFVLEEIGSSHRIEVAECEPDVTGERLQLLAVVRGLEALEQASRVTLITSSRYVAHGIRRHLNEWRENGFRWERFGEMRAIKNRDLWLRVDNALNFHSVDCRIWQFASAASIGQRLGQTKPVTPVMEPAHENHMGVSEMTDQDDSFADNWVQGERGWKRLGDSPGRKLAVPETTGCLSS